MSNFLFAELFKMCAPIVVRRDDRDSREYAIEEIKKRATAMKEEREVARGKVWSQLLIFPEGTCGNLTQLLVFKPGMTRTVLYFNVMQI